LDAAKAFGYVSWRESVSISLTAFSQPVSVDADGNLSPFSADATGLFSTMPEPGSMGLLVLSLCGLGLRRGRMK
jgi:hypothetical protein